MAQGKICFTWNILTMIWKLYSLGGRFEEKRRAEVCTPVHGASCVHRGLRSCSRGISAHGTRYGRDQEVPVSCECSEIPLWSEKCSFGVQWSADFVLFYIFQTGHCLTLNRLHCRIITISFACSGGLIFNLINGLFSSHSHSRCNGVVFCPLLTSWELWKSGFCCYGWNESCCPHCRSGISFGGKLSHIICTPWLWGRGIFLSCHLLKCFSFLFLSYRTWWMRFARNSLWRWNI